MANALLYLDVTLTEKEREYKKGAPCTQGHFCSFPERRNEMKAEELTLHLSVVPAQDWLRYHGRWYCSFLKENMHSLGNCVQHYCIKKGKSSLVGDRELTFKSVAPSLRHLALFCTRKAQNCLLTIGYAAVPEWPETQPPQCQSGQCPRAATNAHKMSWCSDTAAAGNGWPRFTTLLRETSSSQLQLQPLPHLHPLEVLAQVFTSSWSLGTPDQTYPHPWPSTSLTAADIVAKAPHFGDPNLQ